MHESLPQPEPRPEFAARLQAHIADEVRRRNQQAHLPRWSTWSPVQALAAAALIGVVSMGIGGAAVVASYEVRDQQERSQLVAMYEQRAELARQRRDLAAREHTAAQQRFNVGISDVNTVLEKGLAVAESQGAVDTVALDLAEIAVTAREPNRELFAPRVSGRDFVGERLRIERSVLEASRDVIQRLAADLQVRVEIGTLRREDLNAARIRGREVEGALETVVRKEAIRGQFLAGRFDAIEAHLRGLEAASEQRIATLRLHLEQARRAVTDAEQRVEVGVMAAVDVAEANLRRLEFETELTRADIDLALIRKRLAEHRKD
jgi:hypothetical protein